MMKYSNDCKGCQRNVSVTDEPLIYYSDSSIEDHDDDEFVHEDLYSKRVQLCLDCTSLQYGSTCKYSGVLISYKAKRKNKSCPMPGAAKW
ncbi:hypothetical protein [Halalkalibacter flavus]|uniref:hypothetical protein n=1 Tax=Halalkalibacter flavus TaxID=3090668 RepID=UPI002FC5B804